MNNTDEFTKMINESPEAVNADKEHRKMEDYINKSLDHLKRLIHEAVDKFFNCEKYKQSIIKNFDYPFSTTSWFRFDPDRPISEEEIESFREENPENENRPVEEIKDLITAERQEKQNREVLKEQWRSIENYYLDENLADELRYFLIKEVFNKEHRRKHNLPDNSDDSD